MSSLQRNGWIHYSKMADDIVEWLSDTEKWLSRVRLGAREVDRFNRSRPTWSGRAEPIGLVKGAWHVERELQSTRVGFDRRSHAWLGHLVGWLGHLVQVMDRWVLSRRVINSIYVCVYIYILISLQKNEKIQEFTDLWRLLPEFERCSTWL
jgi:hypothetical protein